MGGEFQDPQRIRDNGKDLALTNHFPGVWPQASFCLFYFSRALVLSSVKWGQQ